MNMQSGSDASGHGSLVSYIIGFILSIALTVLAFGAVTQQWFSPFAIMIFVTVMAVFQLLIQLVFFLHLGAESKPYWNLSAFLFAMLITVIIVAGSIWIMYHLNVNMQM
ncbi:MAG: cytochrome o ubiquinol oxidase subunit IV [Endozoicomonadaceae bacterium]|nr:cytochrome o ubiquinol oxidase subunit IV [Endozoicomonadaceae bacterium]MCY4328570.1 cytochrome o ubiquinol oxidase subunit IV [Endozoicomonadaceae bacterium]